MRYFHGGYSIGDDTLWGVNRRKKGTVNTLATLRSIRAASPDGAPIYVILDNLSAHQPTCLRDWAKEHRVELCFNPDLRLLGQSHRGPPRTTTAVHHRQLEHPNHPVQTRALHAYLRWRNANTRARDVLAAERRERARIRSEKGIRWGGRPALAA